MKLLSMLVLLSLLAGCSGSKESDKESKAASSELRRYEADFRPSDYDIDPAIFISEVKREKERTSIPSEPAVLEPPTVVQGYRVQIIATTQIDEANETKAAAELFFPREWFYIAFDPPTYKVRTGNFLSRTDAETYAKALSEHGYQDAWVVPDRIHKNIPPRREQLNEPPPRH